MVKYETLWSQPKVVESYVKNLEDGGNNKINITKKHYHDPFFFSLFPKLSDDIAVLDLACGNGYISELLKSENATLKVTALDTHGMLSQGYINPGTEVERVAAVAQNLPFGAMSYDFLFSSMLLHWAENADQIISEMHRVLTTNGTVVASLANPRLFKAGTFVDMHTDNPRFIRSIDSNVSQQLQVMLDGTIGPLTYYLRPVHLYLNLFSLAGFVDIELYEPTMNDESLLNKYDFLKKYKNHPLYLFVKARK